MTVVPREIEDNGYAKIRGRASKVYYGRCTNGDIGFETLSSPFIQGAREWSRTFQYQNLLNIAVIICSISFIKNHQ